MSKAPAGPTITFEAKSWAWIPHPTDMYLPGKCNKTFKSGEAGSFVFEDGKEVQVTAKESPNCIPLDEASLKIYDNMIKMNDLNEPTLLHNLRQRFLKDDIYTYVSSILVAANPFKLLPIYTPDVMEKYKDGKGRDAPPHIYAISDNAYRALMETFKDQAVVISGESGAGKTETMKLVLQFLADVSGRAQKQATQGDKQTESLEQQILKSNPVMEAFGNAKTTRNNNSSRFGKWTEIKFNKFGAIIGGSIINYLLEKSRIPWQAQQERNYHIFYQLIAGGEVDLAMKKQFKLKDAEEFHYMNQSGVTTVDSINDEKDWLEMSGAMDVLNMSKEEKDDVFRTVAGILHLGDVIFDKDPKGSEETDSKVKSIDTLKLAAELFQVDYELFAKSLCFKKITRPGSKSVTYARYSIAKAGDARDATSKAVYGKMFDYLIQMVNRALVGIGGVVVDASKEKIYTIGVLDIFGFESFPTNSFEQLCINYCNEKLQFHFNEYIFKIEQAEYASEGVPVDMIEFKDNQPTLDMLEDKKGGIFAMVDEEISVPKGSDEGLVKKIITKHEKHPNFAKPKPTDLNSKMVFIVIHYAGAVPYNVTNFLEKDRDALQEDLVECLCSSKSALVSKLLIDQLSDKSATAGAAKKRLTLGAQFKLSLEGLMVAMYKCEPHFVRCMKSNHQKKGNIFESDMMMAQLRYAGLLEVCRIRKIGFPVRKVFSDFLFRYRCLDLLTAKQDLKKFCASLEAKKYLKSRQWCIGNTKVFMRNLQQTELEEAREGALRGVVTKMQALARRFICKCRYLRYKVVLKELRAAIAKRTEEALDAALSGAGELPFGGGHIKVVKEARALKDRLEEERRILALCTDAIKARDLAELKNACQAAADAVFDHATVAEACKLRDLMEKEKLAVKKLKDAIDARKLEELLAAIKEADGFGKYVVETDSYTAAQTLKARIEEEEASRAATKAAIKARDYRQLTAAINKAGELNIDQEEIVKQALATRVELEEHEKALEELRAAVAERAADPLDAALKRCKKVELPDSHEEVKAAKALLAKVIEEKEVEDELLAAAASKALERIEKALKKAEKMAMPETAGVKACNTMAERLRGEAAAIAALKAAMKLNKATAILTAINKCNELGIEGKEIDAAKEVLGKLGEQSEALLRLSEALKAADIDAIDEELAALTKMGLGDEEEVLKARDDKKRIVKQNKCAAALGAAIEKRRKEEVKALLAEAEELNVRVRFEEVIAKGARLLEVLDVEANLGKALDKCVAADDEEELDATAAKALAACPDSEEIEAKIAAAREALKKRQSFVRKLVDAMDADPVDKEALQALIDEAGELKIRGAKVDAAVALLNRDRAQKEGKKLLKKAMKGTDEKALAEAIERAIQVGFSGEELDTAKTKCKQLSEEKELSGDVRAAMKSLAVKADSKNGVSKSDVEPLDKAIAEARAKGLSDDSPFLVQAIEARDKVKTIVSLQSEINKVIETENLRQMKKLLDKAEDADLSNSALVKKLRARVRELERARSVAALADDGMEENSPSLDDEEMKRQREEKMKKASNAKFAWDRYSKIRSGDDFARSIFLNKKKVKFLQLKWQNSVIPTSVLDYVNKDLAKLGTRVHKCILGYTGDKSMSFPATLAQDILQKGLECPDLVDEIYVQLCKHLTNNPRPESAVRAWQLMCMSVGTFPPSRDFENHLINFILLHKDGAGAVGNYARYSLRRLEGILNSGPSGFVPSVEEIQAYKERPPILATIELVDGTPLTEDLPITPDLNVAKVLDICYHFLELSDARMQYFGVFVEDVEDPSAPPVDETSDDAPPYAGLIKTPRPLQNENYMGDVVTVKVRQNQPFKFVFKRKIFLKNLDGPSEDPMFERLTYLQAVDEVVTGNIPLNDEEEAVKLAAQAMVVDLMDAFPETAEELVDSDVMEYIPKNWRRNKKELSWAEKVLKHYKKFKGSDKRGYGEMEAEEIQSKYVETVRDHPLYGTNFFHVKKNNFPEQMNSFPKLCIIALNSEGLHFLNEEFETLSSFGYADIYRWGGSSTQFSIIIWNPDTQDTDDVSMYTSQAADMAALILDYINAIMATNEAT